MEILVDRQIRQGIKDGLFGEGLDERFIQPASYDMRIGNRIYDPLSTAPDKSYDMSKNGGAYRIPPYGLVVVETHEILSMPKDHVGRIGLQSRLARKGIIASCGPQVDPGFEGKLFVTLQNWTNAAQIVGYLHTFLTIEFIKLGQVPETSYHGPYQHRKTLGPDVLADLAMLEGPSLSQMHRQFTELAEHVKEWSTLAARFDEFLREMKQQREATTLLMKQFAEKTPEIVETREISFEQAKKEILEFFRQRRGESIFYSDIADELQLDFATVMKAFAELEKEGAIKGVKE